MVSSVASSSRKGSRRSEKSCGLFQGSANICKGEELLKNHGWRLTWWVTMLAALVGVILVAVCAEHMADDSTSAWNTLAPNTSISPSARSMGALVGLMLVFSAYTTYMLGHGKGHLDNFPVQFALSMLIHVSLWVFFIYGLAYGGTIGSSFSLLTLTVLVAWGIMTSHTKAPYYTWLTLLELGFLIYLYVWLSLSKAALFPSP